MTDTGLRPGLRGLGWGLLALVVAAVVLFSALLVLNRDPAEPTGPAEATLRGSWDLDEGSGTTAAGPPALTFRTGAGWTERGRVRSAAHFDRGYAATDGPVVDTTADHTVSAWVRLDRLPTDFATAVSQDSVGYSAFYLQYVPEGRRWAMSSVNGDGSSVRALSAAEAVPARWTHLVGVRDVTGGRMLLYVDGVRQSTVLFDQRPVATGPLALGRGLFGDRQVDFFPGSVDIVRVYSEVLTDAEIQALYEPAD